MQPDRAIIGRSLGCRVAHGSRVHHQRGAVRRIRSDPAAVGDERHTCDEASGKTRKYEPPGLRQRVRHHTGDGHHPKPADAGDLDAAHVDLGTFSIRHVKTSAFTSTLRLAIPIGKPVDQQSSSASVIGVAPLIAGRVCGAPQAVTVTPYTDTVAPPIFPTMRRLVPRGLRGRLVLLLTVASLPALATVAYERVDRRRLETEGLRQTAATLARLAAQAQERRLEGARQLLTVLSRSSDLSGDPSRCGSFVRRLIADYGTRYTEIGWADQSGRVVCHALDAPGPLSIEDRSYFQRVLRTRAFVVGELMQGRLSGRSVLAFAYPKLDALGQVTGVVFANVDLHSWSDSLRGDIDTPNAVVSVLDRSGVGIARSEGADGWIGTRVSAAQLAAMSSRRELVADSVGPDGVPRVYGVVNLRDHTGEPVLFVVVGLARDTLIASTNRRLRFDLATVAALGGGLLIAVWFATDRLIRRPVDRLVDATAALARGDLHARAPIGTGTRELEVLGAAFNEMATRLEQRDLHLRKGQRLEAVGQLAGGIAHDFNNLLTVIVGYGESLSRHLTGSREAAAELAELRTAAERAANLTRQLLAFSRQQMLQPRIINLGDAVAAVHGILRRTIGDDITLITVDEPELGNVRADPTQVEQVLLNLVINARDAMPDGGRITIETKNVDLVSDLVLIPLEELAIPRGSYVYLSVTDTGVGMDAATRARIFEPFFSTKDAGGTGLGLATVYGIVKQSGGYITCTSEPGTGTTFAIYLPRTLDRPDEGGAAQVVSPAGGAEAILLVEDESAVRSLVAKVLSRSGYAVTAVPDGKEAVTWLESGGMVDLLITDVQMPGMSGHALAEHARRMRPQLPLLFISGYSKEMLSPNSDNDGKVGFLTKPFTPVDVLRKVRELLDGRFVARRLSAE
jgi:signal transduction histidine kinase/CheY-like chemotaxis protein